MVAPEAIGPLQRYAALVSELPVIRLAEPVARELGLRAGQVIQASIEAQADGVALKVNERLFMLPPGWQRHAAGDMRWFQVVRQGALLGLKLLPSAPQTAPGAAGAVSAPTSGLLAASIAPPATPATVPADAAGAMSQRLSSLLGRPPSFDSLFNVLRPGVLESLLAAQPGGAGWAGALAALRLRVDHLSANVVQQSILLSGLWSESLFAAGRMTQGLDLKALLRQSLRLLGPQSPHSEELSTAIESIDRTQVEALQAQTEHRLSFSVMLPFADAEPARLRYEREPRRPGQGAQRHIIDLHLKPANIGELWIKTAILSSSLDLTVWTARSDVAQLVEQYRDELAVELSEAGLVLQSFQVIDSPRPEQAEAADGAGRSSVDLRA